MQIALDLIQADVALEIAQRIASKVDILEIGTPLLKAVGVRIITDFKAKFPDKLILADTKTMDVGALEARLAFNAGADMMTVCAAAPLETIQSATSEAQRWHKDVVVDFIGVKDKRTRALEIVPLSPAYFNLHTAIDVQKTFGKSFRELAEFRDFQIPLVVAGGIAPEDIPELMKYQPAIIVVGSFVTRAKDPFMAVMALRRAIEDALS